MKIMTIKDIQKLRHQAKITTHLARYETANATNAKRLLDVPCCDCGAAIGIQCFNGS